MAVDLRRLVGFVCTARKEGPPRAAKVGLKVSPVPANQWFTMEVVAHGFHMTILVDGKTVADYIDDDRIGATGRIRLQVMNPQTLVKFRKVQIQELRRPEE